MKTVKFKRVVVSTPFFKEERKPITQLMQSNCNEKEIDLRQSGGYSDIGLKYEIERGSIFFIQEVEFRNPYKFEILSENLIDKPTIQTLRKLDAFSLTRKNW